MDGLDLLAWNFGVFCGVLQQMELLRDVRYAARQLRLAPVFSVTVMVTLALGIGATTAIFSLVHAVMLRSLPVVDPASLWRIGDTQECCVEGGRESDALEAVLL